MYIIVYRCRRRVVSHIANVTTLQDKIKKKKNCSLIIKLFMLTKQNVYILNINHDFALNS